jgi:hypothetical protein
MCGEVEVYIHALLPTELVYRLSSGLEFWRCQVRISAGHRPSWFRFSVFPSPLPQNPTILPWLGCDHFLPSIHGSTARCCALAAFLVSGSFYTVGRTPWKGDQPVAKALFTHRTTQTQIKLTTPVFERAKMVHALDRAATVICSIHHSPFLLVNAVVSTMIVP